MIAEHDPGDEDDAAVRCPLGCGSRATPRDGLPPACVRFAHWWDDAFEPDGAGPPLPLPPQHARDFDRVRGLVVPLAVLSVPWTVLP